MKRSWRCRARRRTVSFSSAGITALSGGKRIVSLWIWPPLKPISRLAPASAFAGDFDNLDFMTGHWRGEVSGGVVEEWWSPAAGGAKIAAFRWARDEATDVIELVIVSEEAEGVFLRFKHFNADYSTWEADEPNVYPLVSAKDGRTEFRRLTPNEDVPDALIYERKGEGLVFRGADNPEVESHPDDLALAFERVR